MMTPRERCWPICVDQVALEPHHLSVIQGSVDRRDQVLALSQDRDQRRPVVHYPAVPSCLGAVAEQPLGLLEAALQVADRVHLAEVDADGDQRLGDLRRQPGDDDARTHQT